MLSNLYSNVVSCHSPLNKHSVLSALIHRAKVICDSERLHVELSLLQKFLMTTVTTQNIHHAVNLFQL
jgi:hypothetical protein